MLRPQDPLHSALDSFYSDIAAIENSNSNDGLQPLLVSEESAIKNSEINLEQFKKKKKKVCKNFVYTMT